MKKVILTTGIAAMLFISLNSTNFVHSNPTGAPAASTGAPKTVGTETTCARSGCHGSSLNAGPHSVDLAISGNPVSFDPGTTYTLTTSIVNATGSAGGFQMVCLDPAKASCGTFTAGTGSKLVSLSGRSYLTHSSKSRKTWTYTWKAPTTSPDSVTFYFASMETVSGTYHTYTSKKVLRKTVVTANEDLVAAAAFTLYPVPATDRLHISTEGFSSTSQIAIFGTDGKLILKTTLVPGAQFGQIDLPVSMLPGQYVVRIQNENGMAARRFTKL